MKFPKISQAGDKFLDGPRPSRRLDEVRGGFRSFLVSLLVSLRPGLVCASVRIHAIRCERRAPMNKGVCRVLHSGAAWCELDQKGSEIRCSIRLSYGPVCFQRDEDRR